MRFETADIADAALVGDLLNVQMRVAASTGICFTRDRMSALIAC